MAAPISTQRKTAYYIGGALMVVGGLLFASVLLTAALDKDPFEDFQGKGRSSMLRGLLGMGLLVAGGVVRSIGARGLAGSGLLLDPEKARKDLEPHSRMVGGMVKDVLEEADVHLGTKAPPVVMIRCRACGKLNEEDSKHCQECGKAL